MVSANSGAQLIFDFASWREVLTGSTVEDTNKGPVLKEGPVLKDSALIELPQSMLAIALTSVSASEPAGGTKYPGSPLPAFLP